MSSAHSPTRTSDRTNLATPGSMRVLLSKSATRLKNRSMSQRPTKKMRSASAICHRAESTTGEAVFTNFWSAVSDS